MTPNQLEHASAYQETLGKLVHQVCSERSVSWEELSPSERKTYKLVGLTIAHKVLSDVEMDNLILGGPKGPEKLEDLWEDSREVADIMKMVANAFKSIPTDKSIPTEGEPEDKSDPPEDPEDKSEAPPQTNEDKILEIVGALTEVWNKFSVRLILAVSNSEARLASLFKNYTLLEGEKHQLALTVANLEQKLRDMQKQPLLTKEMLAPWNATVNHESF